MSKGILLAATGFLFTGKGEASYFAVSGISASTVKFFDNIVASGKLLAVMSVESSSLASSRGARVVNFPSGISFKVGLFAEIVASGQAMAGIS